MTDTKKILFTGKGTDPAITFMEGAGFEVDSLYPGVPGLHAYNAGEYDFNRLEEMIEATAYNAIVVANNNGIGVDIAKHIPAEMLGKTYVVWGEYSPLNPPSSAADYLRLSLSNTRFSTRIRIGEMLERDLMYGDLINEIR